MAEPTEQPARKYATPPETVEGEGITLRRWHLSDVDEHFAIVKPSMPELSKWMSWATNGYTKEDSEGFLKFSNGNWEKGGDFDFAIVDNGKLAGSASLMKPLKGDKGFAIGYWVATSCTGRGLAKRASILLTKTAFDMGAECVQIGHDVNNLRSRTIPEKLGFKCLGEIKSTMKKDTPDVVWQVGRPEQ